MHGRRRPHLTHKLMNKLTALAATALVCTAALAAPAKASAENWQLRQSKQTSIALDQALAAMNVAADYIEKKDWLGVCLTYEVISELVVKPELHGQFDAETWKNINSAGSNSCKMAGRYWKPVSQPVLGRSQPAMASPHTQTHEQHCSRSTRQSVHC